ncbi:MYND finger family protein [Babesia bovis T2Bo]|uniref:MYND-type domain-containing protein n=1 Tax=Babesia bovis TaxID=5865 RepID=A7AMK4_BABBO|nr:MYND finger family protein [Babesia bovis T2Bo]EDO07788.1 MYND finger family protein [Babesia bovis T2Bo]|eukprot:XP_001611356.1 hypothetical protein [Babesia bovis T2Bo]
MMNNQLYRSALLIPRANEDDQAFQRVTEPPPTGESATSATHVEAYPSCQSNDDLQHLKDLFFHSKLNPNFDWVGLCLVHQHDYKFWANVTHTLGMLILKTLFNSDVPFEDSHAFGLSDCNYVNGVKVRAAFVLLGGLLSNRLPGSLRLIVRGNGYQFFEHRIGRLLRDIPDFDEDAICFNMNALRTLLPFLQECTTVRLNSLCHRFITSGFWRVMWMEVGMGLKSACSTQRLKLFCNFLELASTIFFGSRSSTFFKRMYTSCANSLWDPVVLVLSWALGPRACCNMVTFVADILLMSHQDGCLDDLPGSCLDSLHKCITTTVSEGESYLELYDSQTLDERNEFRHHYATIAVSMLKSLDKVLTCQKNRTIEMALGDLYDISSLGTAKMTLPPFPGSTEQTGPKFDFSEWRVFPRVLPCFNKECTRILHLDMPELHIDGELPDFRYCDQCGIPSYCSAECASAHWDSYHKEVCGFFRAPPTFARFMPHSPDDGIVVLQTMEDNWMMTPFIDEKGNLLTLF